MKRAIQINLFGIRRVLVGLLCAVALLAYSGEVAAQAQGPAETEAQRIARLRDQAATAGASGLNDAAAVTASPDDASAVAAAASEPEPELPPNEALPLGSGEGELFNTSTTGTTGTGGVGDGWVMSTLAALGVVIALVFGLRWVLRRGGVASASVTQGSVVEVLSRTTVAPRSHVLLLRVGQQILIVNDSPAGMRTLATVQDPEEVAELLGSIDVSRPTSFTRSFSGVMSRLSNNWSEDPEPMDAEDMPGVDRPDENGLASQGAVRSVRGRLASLAGGGLRA